jgi:hypothetical protein
MLEKSNLIDLTFKYVHKRSAKAKFIALIAKKYPVEKKKEKEDEDWSDATES